MLNVLNLFTLVTPWLHHGYTFTFLCDLGDFTAEPKLLSLVVFCPCCRLADTWQQAPWLSKGPLLGCTWLYCHTESYLFAKRDVMMSSQDEMCTSKLRLGSWPFSASVCNMIDRL